MALRAQFVPSFFFHSCSTRAVTLNWVASLLATAAFLFVLAGLLGRKRHPKRLPRRPSGRYDRRRGKHRGPGFLPSILHLRAFISS